MSEEMIKSNPARVRKAVVPPTEVPTGMSLFDYLCQCQPPLDQKIIDIACSQNQVPSKLKDDAAQEIRLMWTQLKPDTALYKPGQIAAYAHRMAGHAALRLRREVGAAVRLPGSAFRRRKDGSSYVTPGVLAEALEWDKLESWFSTDEPGGDAAPSTEAPMSDMGLNPLQGPDDEPIVEEDEEAVARDERLDLIQQHRDELTPRQYAIMESLINGETFDDVMKEREIKKGVLMREMAVISTIVGVQF